MLKVNQESLNLLTYQIAMMRAGIFSGTGRRVNDADRKLAERVYLLFGADAGYDDILQAFDLENARTYAQFLRSLGLTCKRQSRNIY